MAESTLYLKNHPNGPGYYYFDETWTDLIGPFESKIVAEGSMAKDTNEENFWSSQFSEASAGEFIPPIPTEEQRDIAWNKEVIVVPKKRVELNEVNDLFELEGLIDGGYMSFVYGSRKENFGGWNTAKLRYSNFLMLMDSAGVRQSEYEPYKSRRNERREAYDYMMETYDRVKEFRVILKADPMVKTASLDGYEADDLIAILFLKGIGTKLVIAQDKDFFMVKGLREAMVDHHGIPQSHRDLKLPKYAIPPNNPGSWVLTQAIFGDKSDSIPRLLPSKSGYRDVYNLCIKMAPNLLSAYWNCAAQFGEQFITNLRLALLPHPTLSEVDYSLPNLLFEDLCNGEFWNPDNFSNEILEEVIKDSKNVSLDW